MSKLFISYRRKSWGFTHRLADELRERLDAEVFVDVDSIDQTDFEKAIVNHLRQSDALLLVVSETTFIDRIHRDDDWVRREIREALTLGLPLVLVNVDGLLPPSGLPDDIKDIARMQGVNFYPEFFTPAVERLTDFVTRVSSVKRKGITGVAHITLEQITVIAAGTVEDPPERQISGRASLDEALDLIEQGDYSKAIFLLEGLRDSGLKSRFVNIDELLQDAQEHQKQVVRRREAQLDYEEISAVVKRQKTHKRGIAAFQRWQEEYADLVNEYDTENISDQVSLVFIPAVIKRVTVLDLMPKPFEWVNIPAGEVIIGGYGYRREPTKFYVAAYSIAKYPLTNQQFAKFIDAGGYKQEKWWTARGWKTREKSKWTQPLNWSDVKWNKADHPIVGVSWYEAVAFCLWLSEETGESILLPTDRQWQRAAQGDTRWAYPYGNKFDETRCNFNNEATTSVTRYEGSNLGDSPFGVTDMSGNAVEWCLTLHQSEDDSLDGTGGRALKGGSRMHKDPIPYLSVSAVNWYAPDIRISGGFRIVRN